MNTTIFVGLINNVALLLALGLLHDTLTLKQRSERCLAAVLIGLIFGTVGIAVMLNPWEFMPGVIFDTRSVLLSVGGLFFGFTPTLVAILVTGAYRLYQGGAGMWTGVAVIVTSGGIGVGWKYFRRNGSEKIPSFELYILGLVVHIVMLLWMLLLPWSLAMGVLSKIGVPVMIIHPVATVLLGKLMINRLTRRRTEEALRESEEKYRVIVNTAPYGLQVTDLAGKILFSNPAHHKIQGYAAGELIGQYIWELVADDADKALIKEYYKQSVTEQRRPEVYFNRDKTKDGRLIDAQINWDYIRNARGEIEGIISIVSDITERVRAEKALRESETRLHTVLQNMPVMLDAFDAQGNIIVWNKECERVTGYSAAEIINNPQALELLYPDAAYRTRMLTAWAARDEDYYNWEWQITGKHGAVKTVAWSKISQRLPIPGWATWGIGMDVTERKQAEDARQLEHTRLMGILNAIPDGVYIVNQQYDIEYINPVIAREFGPIAGRKCYTYLHDLTEPCPWCQNDKVFAGQSVQWEWYSVKNDHHYDLFGMPFKNADGSISKFEMFYDITARKQAEEQIKASLREKEVLLQEIHHRVKNNLAIISSLLSFQAEITSDEQARAAFQESQNRIRAMARIHEHLYGSSDLARIDMAEYIRGVAHYLRQTYQVYTIALQVDVVGVELDMDRALPCGLIINELVSNAFKYAFPAGVPRPKTAPPQVHVGLRWDADGQCVLTVGDNGVGLPTALQLESVKRESLGLWLVNLLSQQLKGTLQVDREGGTTFCLTFPIPEERSVDDGQ